MHLGLLLLYEYHIPKWVYFFLLETERRRKMRQFHYLSSSPLASQNPNLCPNRSLSSLYSISRPPFVLRSCRFSLTKAFRKNSLSVKCRQSEFFERFNGRTSHNDSSFAPQSPATRNASSSPRVFVGHSIYKGKAALTVEPKAPQFTSLDSGAFKISREGYVLLQFAPAAGIRQYDWSKKQVFSLSVTEVGNLVSLGARDSCEFFHDPFKGRSEEGKIRKLLKVEPLPDGSGRLFNLSVQNKLLNMDDNIFIPITKAEYAVLVSAFNFILPFLIGWHTFANSTKPDDNSLVNNANLRYGGDFEWRSR